MSSYYWEHQCLHPVIIHVSVLAMPLTDAFRDTTSSWGKENCQQDQQDPGTPETTGKQRRSKWQAEDKNHPFQLSHPTKHLT